MLHLAQPAVGFQIRQLEAELGTTLLMRHARGIAPTAAGKMLYEDALCILNDVEELGNRIRGLKGGQDLVLRLGVVPSMVSALGPELLMASPPDASGIAISLLETRSAGLQEGLEHGQIDVAFLNDLGEVPGVDSKAVVEEDLLLVSAPSKTSADAQTIGFAKALEHDLAIGGESSILYAILAEKAQKLSLKLRVAYRFHSIASVKTMLMQNQVATIMPYSLFAEEIRSGALVGRRIVDPAMVRTLYIGWQRAHGALLASQSMATHLDSIVSAYVEAVEPFARRIP